MARRRPEFLGQVGPYRILATHKGISVRKRGTYCVIPWGLVRDLLEYNDERLRAKRLLLK